MAGNSPERSRSSANVESACASMNKNVSFSGTISGMNGSSPGGREQSRIGSSQRHDWVALLIKNEGSGILRLLWRLLGREQDVMDAYQDCFCKLAECAKRMNPTNAKAYAYRTATNVAIELIRVRSRRAAHWPRIAAERSDTRPDEAIQDSPVGRGMELRHAIGNLPGHLRNVVVLRDLSRMTYKEVAGTLGIEVGTARVYRRHAVVKLGEMLSQGETP